MKYIPALQTGIRIILVVLLFLFGLSNIKQNLTASMNIGDTGSKELDQWEADMQLVREALPIDRGLVGYISEEDLEGAEFAYWDNETEFLLTQYALAPLILKKGLAAEWNVVVLRDQDIEQWLRANPGEYELINIKGRFNLLHNLSIP